MDVAPDLHRQLAAALFNRTWDLLDMSGRTADEDDELLTAAFASKLHWARTEGVTAENLAVADNQIARAACAAGFPDVAVAYAARALDAARREGWTDWRLASAHEVSARAAAAAGDAAGRDAHVARARAVLATVDDADDRAVIEAQLDTVP